MNNKLTATAIALLLGLATPFALSTAALAQAEEPTVVVTFTGQIAADLGLEDGAIRNLPLALAATVCDTTQEALTLDPNCEATTAPDELQEFLEGLEAGTEGEANENSAKAYAPGQMVKSDGGSARDYAPGQVAKGDDGGTAQENAPGQQKKAD